jgi:hypothetical protein
MCFVIARISSGQSSICIPSVLAQPTVAQSVNDQRRIPSKCPNSADRIAQHGRAQNGTALHGTARLEGSLEEAQLCAAVQL